MTVTSWLVYCTAVSLLMAVAGWAAESALRALARPVRWAWAASITGTVLVPAAAWFGLLDGLIPSARVAAVPQVGAPAGPSSFVSGAEAEVGSVSADAGAGLLLPAVLEPALRVGWLLATAALAVVLIAALVRLRRLRGSWRAAVVDGVAVWISRELGPAVVGIWRGAIVVPAWALGLERRVRRFMLLHEREHLESGDSRLCSLSFLPLLLMPWNLPLWWQVRRLRLAVELDCDARVLRRAPDVRTYGAVLLEVGRRRSGLGAIGVAFAEPASALERRIRLLPKPGARPRVRRGLALAVVAVLAATGSFWLQDPPRGGAELAMDGAAGDAWAVVGPPVASHVAGASAPVPGSATSVDVLGMTGSAPFHTPVGEIQTLRLREQAVVNAAELLASPAPPVSPGQEALTAGIEPAYTRGRAAVGAGGGTILQQQVDDSGRPTGQVVSRSGEYGAPDGIAAGVQGSPGSTPGTPGGRAPLPASLLALTQAVAAGAAGAPASGPVVTAVPGAEAKETAEVVAASNVPSSAVQAAPSAGHDPDMAPAPVPGAAASTAGPETSPVESTPVAAHPELLDNEASFGASERALPPVQRPFTVLSMVSPGERRTSPMAPVLAVPVESEEPAVQSPPEERAPAPQPRLVGRIAGTVIDAETGEPVAGAVVQIAGGRQAATNTSGRFLLYGVPVGVHEVEVRHEASGSAGARGNVEVTPEATTLVNLTVGAPTVAERAPREASGRRLLLNPARAPLDGATDAGAGLPARVSFRSDGDGASRLAGPLHALIRRSNHETAGVAASALSRLADLYARVRAPTAL